MPGGPPTPGGEVPYTGERVPLDVLVVDRYGRPVPGAVLRAAWGEWIVTVGSSDAEGRAALSVPRGTRSLEVGGADPVEGRRYLFLHYHPLVGGEAFTRVVVRLGAEIRGRLVTADGTPLARATVRAVPQPWGFGPAETDAEGRFRLDALEGEEVEVRFDGLQVLPETGQPALRWLDGNEQGAGAQAGSPAPAHAPDAQRARRTRTSLRASRREVVPGRGEIELTALPAEEDADLVLRVLAPDGRPEPRAVVTLGSSMATGLTAIADGLGTVTFQRLPRWPVSLRVAPASHSGERDLWRPVHLEDVHPGGPVTEVRLPEVGALRGRVLDAEGKPVARAWCAALEGAGYAACFATDAEGRFDACSNVPAGTRVQLSARWPMDKPRFRGVLPSVVVGSGDLTIVLEPIPDAPVPAR